MKKIITTLLILGAAIIANAQTTNKAITEHDPAIRAKDSIIKVTIIDPTRKAANGDAPDWAALTAKITQQYDATTADRTISKAKIYFYYAKDKAIFCKEIVHYTNNYELADDYKLLNLNAGLILQSSEDQANLKAAARWAKAAAGSDPNNAKYQQTLDALQGKVNP